MALVTAAGIALRLLHYLDNRSLGVDEALISLNVMRRSPVELLEQLDNNSAAPLGFLLVEKGMAGLLGASEPALRLWPLLCAVAAAVLFVPFAARLLGEVDRLIAVGLFAFTWPLIAYAATVKQYAGDVLVMLAVYLVAFAARARLTTRGAVALGIAGAAGVWFSHPAVFVLAAVGIVLAVEHVRARRVAELRRLAAVGGAWAASFVVTQLLTRRGLESVRQSFAGDGEGSGVVGDSDTWASLQGTIGGTYRWLLGVPHIVIRGFDLGDAIAVGALLLALVGLGVMLRRRPGEAMMLALPAGIVGVAGALDRYPLVPRTLLFLAPAAIAFTALGGGTGLRSTRVLPRLAGVVVLGALFAAAFGNPVERLVVERALEGHPARFEQLEPAMQYLARRQRPGDTVYLYFSTQFQFAYYLECDCAGATVTGARRRGLWPVEPRPGERDQWAPALSSTSGRFVVGAFTGLEGWRYFDDLDRLEGRSRVWLLVGGTSALNRSLLVDRLDTLGQELGRYVVGSGDAAVGLYLYDLR